MLFEFVCMLMLLLQELTGFYRTVPVLLNLKTMNDAQGNTAFDRN